MNARCSCPLLMLLFCCFCLNAAAVTTDTVNVVSAVYAKKNPILNHRVTHILKPEGSLVQIEGYYESKPEDDETENCGLSVRIKKIRGAYYYTFQVPDKVYKGKVKLTKHPDGQEMGITFTGIKWAEFEGDISRVADEDRPVTLKLPVGIEGMLSDNEIIIQNYGNAMNYYLQIASCGQKYIRLVKQEK